MSKVIEKQKMYLLCFVPFLWRMSFFCFFFKIMFVYHIFFVILSRLHSKKTYLRVFKSVFEIEESLKVVMLYDDSFLGKNNIRTPKCTDL